MVSVSDRLGFDGVSPAFCKTTLEYLELDLMGRDVNFILDEGEFVEGPEVFPKTLSCLKKSKF